MKVITRREEEVISLTFGETIVRIVIVKLFGANHKATIGIDAPDDVRIFVGEITEVPA